MNSTVSIEEEDLFLEIGDFKNKDRRLSRTLVLSEPSDNISEELVIIDKDINVFLCITMLFVD